MLYFPRPYPDEIIGSLLVRACRHTGLPFKRLVHYLSGVSIRSYASFFLTPFLARIGKEAGVDSDELLYGHTVFPYITAFISSDATTHLRSLLLSHRFGHHINVAPFTKTITQGLTFRRMCAKCATEDMESYGESYWHRSHLLPAAYVCPRHRIALIETIVPLRYGTRHWAYALPHELIGKPLEPMPTLNMQLDITARSSALLTNKHEDIDWLHLYRDIAFHRGYGRPPCFVYWAQLAGDMLSLYGPEFLQKAGCYYGSVTMSSWPGLMVRTKRKAPFAPVEHVLLQSFLEAFLEGCTSENKTLTYHIHHSSPAGRSNPDADCVKKMRAVLDAPFVDLKYSATELLTQAGYWDKFRQGRHKFPQTDAFLRNYKFPAGGN